MPSYYLDQCWQRWHGPQCVDTLRPRQNGRLFADDTFKRIFLNENIRISTKNSLKFVPKGLINNIPALVMIMAWRRPGDKPLSEPMLVRSLTHICVTRPQWVNKKILTNTLIQRWYQTQTHFHKLRSHIHNAVLATENNTNDYVNRILEKRNLYGYKNQYEVLRLYNVE